MPFDAVGRCSTPFSAPGCSQPAPRSRAAMPAGADRLAPSLVAQARAAVGGKPTCAGSAAGTNALPRFTASLSSRSAPGVRRSAGRADRIWPPPPPPPSPTGSASSNFRRTAAPREVTRGSCCCRAGQVLARPGRLISGEGLDSPMHSDQSGHARRCPFRETISLGLATASEPS